MPMFFSTNHGGISRSAVFAFIDLAHGRASSYVSNDIGATDSGRWHRWQERCRIGATSFVNVTSLAALAGAAPSAGVATANNQSAQIVTARANLTAVDIATSSDVNVGRRD